MPPESYVDHTTPEFRWIQDVALGSGISILPERTIQAEVDQTRLAAIRLNAPELVRPTGIIHRKKKKLTRAGREFLELVTGPAKAAVRAHVH